MNWLLLRGLGRSKEHWYTFPDQLQKETKAKVICLDLPGMDSKDEKIPLRIEHITNSLRDKWLKQVDPNESWGILGVSLGGMIALDWCHRYPDDFKHLITINSSTAVHSSPFKRISIIALHTLIKAGLIKNIKLREKMILSLTTNQIELSDELLNYWENIGTRNKLLKKVFLAQLYAATKFKPPQRINIPYTILVSKVDRFTNYTCSEKLAQYYNAKIYYHEKAGHDLPLDDPKWVIQKILETTER